MTGLSVTVVIPVFNGERYLRAAVASLYAPGHPAPRDVVIVDDASTDRSPAIADELARAYPSLRVLHRRSNGGAAAARWDGCRDSPFALVAALDADDELEPGALSDAVQTLEAEGADMCLWQLVRRNRDGQVEDFIRLERSQFPITGRRAARLTLGGWRIHPLGVARKRVYERAYAALDESPFNADELITRLAFMRASRITVCDSRYIYRQHAASTTADPAPRWLDRVISQAWLLEFAAENGFMTEDPALRSAMALEGHRVLVEAVRSRSQMVRLNGRERARAQLGRLDDLVRKSGGGGCAALRAGDWRRALERAYVRRSLGPRQGSIPQWKRPSSMVRT